MSKPTFDERYAVTMFGFTNELLEASRNPSELVELALETGLTKNIELDGPQYFRNYPRVSDAEVVELQELLTKYDARLSLIGGYADRAAGTHLANSEQIVADLKTQLDLVKRLGGFGLRLQVDAITTDEAPLVARAAEAAGVKIVFELQGSMTPTDPRTTDCLAVVAAADSPNVRLMFDASLFMTCLPPTLKALLTGTGLSAEQIDTIEHNWLTLPFPDYRGWLIGELQAGNLPPQLNSLVPTLLSRIGHSKPADWADYTPMVESVHLKYWDTSDDGAAVSGPTSALMSQLESAGYTGYYCSEWGGHEWHTLHELPAMQAIAWHKRLVEACFNQAH